MSKESRHKWSGKGGRKATGNKGGAVLFCLKCGCVREFVNGKATYFINDTVYNSSPKCDQKEGEKDE